MATVFSKQIIDSTGARRVLALDITDAAYKIQIDGTDVSAAPSQPADARKVTLTAGSPVTFDAQDLGHVGFSGPAGVSQGALPGALIALGRLAAVALNGGASQSAVFGLAGA